jgi:hypothetical protein
LRFESGGKPPHSQIQEEVSMAQRILFASIPNTQSIAFPQTLALLYGEVMRSTPTAKAFREFLRLRNLFDKETFPILMELIDVRMGDPCTIGPFAKKLFDCADEAAARELIAKRLIDENPLLAKFCLEAMDTDKGGRLHSTNELYRMLTSYVYPGAKPTLNAFKAWVDWAVAGGLIRMVGVRWALGERAAASLPSLRAIDPDEFLEEEREAATEPAQSPDEEPEAPEPPVHREEPAASTDAPKPQVADPAAEPVVPSPARSQAPSGGVLARPVRPPSPGQAERGFFVAMPVRPEDLDRNRDILSAWWDPYPGRKPLSLAQVGIDPAHRTPATLFEAAFAALLIGRGEPAEAIRGALESFRTIGLLLSMARGKFPVDALDVAMSQNPDPRFIAACEATVHLPRILKATVDPGALVRANEARELLWNLWRRLYEPATPIAPFVLARFLLEARIVPDSLAAAGFVPFFTVRENAFRIGFTDRLHASGFGELLDIQETLAIRFGPPGFEGPLAQVHEGFGCAFRCGRASACPLACREKGELSIRC